MRFVIGRLLSIIPVMLGVAALVFLTLRLVPGDPALLILQGTTVTPERIAQVHAQLGLDQPLIAQFLNFIGGAIRGDFGTSYVTGIPIANELATRLPSSIALTLGGMLVAVLIGIPAGVIGGLRPNTLLDRVVTIFSVLGVAVPYFWFALILVAVFAVRLHWFPALGTEGLWGLVLPSVALGVGYAAIITRLLRSSLIDVYRQPYILVARSKGLSEPQVLFGYGLRNGISSIVTVIGLQIGGMLSGAVAIEVTFGRNGVGSYLVESVTGKDIPAVQAIVLLIAFVYVAVNILIDVAHGILDPRVRKSW